MFYYSGNIGYLCQVRCVRVVSQIGTDWIINIKYSVCFVRFCRKCPFFLVKKMKKWNVLLYLLFLTLLSIQMKCLGFAVN